MKIAICNSHNFSITQPFVIFLIKYECIFALFASLSRSLTHSLIQVLLFPTFVHLCGGKIETECC
jgi:hypothetical protein